MNGDVEDIVATRGRVRRSDDDITAGVKRRGNAVGFMCGGLVFLTEIATFHSVWDHPSMPAPVALIVGLALCFAEALAVSIVFAIFAGTIEVIINVLHAFTVRNAGGNVTPVFGNGQEADGSSENRLAYAQDRPRHVPHPKHGSDHSHRYRG